MPNHWHLLLTPLEEGALGRFMHWLTTTHARHWQSWRDLGGQGAVYQGRYKAIPIGDDDHFLWVCRYVERSAVRASLVEHAQDWEWSSLTGRRAHKDWLASWPVVRPSEWESLVNIPQTEPELEHFRNLMRKGEPFGTDIWKRAVCAKLGLKLGRRRGRPARVPTATVLYK